MRYIAGYCRTQRLLWPDLLDDYVTEEHPVRFMDAYGESLDRQRRGFARAQAAPTGRPAYEPRDLLKLDIYGYRNRLRSSRRLEREPHRHVELSWLLRQLRPDFKTIAEFRTNNPKALQALFRAFVLLCQQLDLFGAELLALDGSKFTAVNSTHKHFTKTTLEKALKAIDEQGAKDLRDLDAADREESSGHQPSSEELQNTIERLKARQQRYHGFVQEITASGEPQLSLTDPDSRSMPKSPKVDVGYHAQSAVDSMHTRIVEQDVTTAGTDDEPLSPRAMRATETLGVERLSAVAEMGYSHGHEINACDEAGSDAYVPKPATSANATLGRFGKERCSYDPPKDCYRCPAGEELPCRFETTELGRHIRSYATAAGRRCPLKAQGTRHKDGRRMTRGVEEHSLESMAERLKATPAIMQERTPRVEPPFGTIKHAEAQGYVLMKGLKNVRADFSLSCVAYNLTRVLTIRGVPRLLVALG